MVNETCFLCDLVELSRTKSIKTLFEVKKQINFEVENSKNLKHNAYTHLNSTLNEATTKKDTKRSNNLIIFGIEEPNHLSSEVKQLQKNDIMKVKNMLLSIGIDVKQEIVEIKRIDQKRDELNRPLLIKLLSFDTKTTILKKAKCLKNVEEFKNVSISPDYSKAKRLKIKLLIKTRIELNKQLRAESPNANYYFSIKDGRIIMINKHNSAPHKTENVKTTNIESRTDLR